jgi:hypothetical protein
MQRRQSRVKNENEFTLAASTPSHHNTIINQLKLHVQ